MVILWSWTCYNSHILTKSRQSVLTPKPMIKPLCLTDTGVSNGNRVNTNLYWLSAIGHLVIPICPSLTLTLSGPSAGVSGSLDSYCSLKPLCSGMGEVVPARTSPTLLPPSPRTVLSLSCFKVSQCINCRDWHCKS